MYDRGMRLKELRRKKRLTQTQAAKRVGVTRASISAYENNTSVPSIEVLINLASLYSSTTDYILGFDNRPIIVMDGLTPRQQAGLESIAEIYIAECKAPRNRR